MGNNSNVRKKTGTIVPFTLSGEYYFSKGLKSYQKRDYGKAKKYLERARMLEPDEPLIPFQLAIVYTENGEFSESNKIFHELLEKSRGKMTECHYFLANNYAYLGLFKEAYQHAVAYLELDEDRVFAEDTEDLLDLLRLEDEELEEDFYVQDELISKHEKARELLQAGRFEEVIDMLQALIEDFPEYWSAYNNMALAYFYLGESETADNILNEVLEKNPGNLHALCNKLVFAYYRQDLPALRFYKNLLVKVKPMMAEQQYKLGATLALAGEYEAAYSLLKRLYKYGFDGEGAFFYWLAYSAYYSGREYEAKKHWQKVLQYEPEKAGLEPWIQGDSSLNGEDGEFFDASEKIHSKYVEVRLFGLFLASMSAKKAEILAGYEGAGELEKQYIQLLNGQSGEVDSVIRGAHEAAQYLHEFHRPVSMKEAGVFLFWFSIVSEMAGDSVSVKNGKACAAAVEYVWRKLRNEKVTQSYIAKQYSLSLSTLRKYVKIINNYLQ